MSVAIASDEPRRWSGAGCLVVVALAMLVHLFRPHSGAVWVQGAAAALFLALEYRRIPPSIRRVAAGVGVVSLALLPFSSAPVESLARGIAIGGLMVSLISSVSLLGRASLESPHTKVVALHLLASGMRTRYAWFSVASQLFGGLLGMAGVNLLLQMASQGEVALEEDRLAMFAAVTRSFAAATLWSPMVSNLTILLALYPGLTWFAIVPLTLGLAAGAVLIGVLLDLWRLRRRGASAPPERPDPSLWAALLPMIGAMAAFLGIVMVVARWLGISVTGAIVIVIPFVVLALHAWQVRGRRRLAQATERLKADVAALPRLAGEVALFMAAGCGGTVIASAIPSSWTAVVGGALAHSAVLACLVLMLAIIVLAFAAVHPVLSSVLVASSLPPAVLGLPPMPHLAAILVGWSLASCATPFSMTALMASRYSGFSIYAVTVRINQTYTVLCIAIASLGLGTASLLMRSHA